MNRFIIRVLNKLKILKYLNIKGSIMLNHKKVSIPVIQQVGYDNLFMTEPWMIDVLKMVLKIENGGFVDVGANIGQTLLKLKSVSESIEYIGFEPNPSCVYYLKNLIEENKFTYCTIIPAGISDITNIEVLHFFSASRTDSSASMITNFRPLENIVRNEYIPVFEFEQIRKKINLNKFSVLKIDVEGAEWEVVKSFYPSIEKCKPIILMEILPVYSEQHVNRMERQKEIIQILHHLDYSVFRVVKKMDVFIDLFEVMEIEMHADINSCEYVMVPNFKKEKLLNHNRQRLQNKVSFV